jgi:hypothetical protein
MYLHYSYYYRGLMKNHVFLRMEIGNYKIFTNSHSYNVSTHY